MAPSSDEPLSLADLAEDRVAKQKVVRSTIIEYLSDDANWKFDDTKSIGEALMSGRGKLVITDLSGGYTNYTYKVSCVVAGADGEQEQNSINLFVKLCFARAFWNPDPTVVYDVTRIANEKIMMEEFGKLAPGCVATPYFLLDVDDMNLLACEWSGKADEQLANQFIDGVADIRVATSLAKSVAALHCSEFDASFNTESRECMVNMFANFRSAMLKSAQGEPSSRAGKLAAEYGSALIETIWDRAVDSYRSTEIPVHGDLHFFNVLVEAKPDISSLERFGNDGSFVICDWEMGMVSALGLDVGRVYSIPVACIISHALSGNDGVSTRFMEYMKLFWEAYEKEMRILGGKDQDFLVRSFRNTIAWLGWKLYAMSIEGWFLPFLPVEKNDIDTLKDCIAIIGLKGMRFFIDDYEPGLGMEELQSVLYGMINDEVERIKSINAAERKRAPALMRSSMLRAQNRRVSDAFQSLRTAGPLRASVIRELEEA